MFQVTLALNLLPALPQYCHADPTLTTALFGKMQIQAVTKGLGTYQVR